jgi:hypothetical protein
MLVGQKTITIIIKLKYLHIVFKLPSELNKKQQNFPKSSTSCLFGFGGYFKNQLKRKNKEMLHREA